MGTNNFTLPLQELAGDPYSFSLVPIDGSDALELVVQAAADNNLWYGR